MRLRNTDNDYGAITKTLHWLTALLVIALICVGLYMTDMPSGAEKIKIYAMHKSFGICVLALTLMRIVWHVLTKRPKPVETLTPFERKSSKSVHYLFYAFLLAMPLTGLMMSSAMNFPVRFFGLFTMPNLVAPDKALAGVFRELHEYIGYTLIAGIGLHVAGALKHRFIDHDRVLARMMPMLLLFLVIATPAAARVWRVKLQDSSIAFKAQQMGGVFEGKFSLFTSQISFDPDNLAASHVIVDIDTSSVDTQSAERDDTLRGKDWFETTVFPTARFETKEITKTGDNAYLAQGSLTIRGVSVPVSLPFTLQIDPTESEKGLRAVMDGSVTLDRSAFGLGGKAWKDPSVIANEVPVSVHLVARSYAEPEIKTEKTGN